MKIIPKWRTTRTVARPETRGIFLSFCDGRVIPQRMLTPVFELSQDDDFVVVIIKTPYVKVSLNFV